MDQSRATGIRIAPLLIGLGAVVCLLGAVGLAAWVGYGIGFGVGSKTMLTEIATKQQMQGVAPMVRERVVNDPAASR